MQYEASEAIKIIRNPFVTELIEAKINEVMSHLGNCPDDDIASIYHSSNLSSWLKVIKELKGKVYMYHEKEKYLNQKPQPFEE